jgi:hypothetical protein
MTNALPTLSTGSLSSSELAAAQQLETFHLFLRNVGMKACQTEEDDAELLVLSTTILPV